MKLVIVESPAKAKTIEKFLGKDYRVAASYGHIRDLPGSAKEVPAKLKEKSWAKLAVDIEGDFRPVYVVPAENKKHVTALKKLLKDADELLLATDEDREGEAISWHLLEVLKPKVPVRRITFHEITKSAIERALENARDVDTQLVRAQEARRVLDRLFGYELSPVLWKKVRTKLSAGRVQSPALRLVVEREEERLAFESTAYWDVLATLSASGEPFTARLTHVDERRVAGSRDFDGTTGEFNADSGAVILDQPGAESVAEESLAAVPWVVTAVERKATRQRPQPPFTTSTLQQAASSRLRMSPRQTMRVAQFLYEGVDLGGGDREGLITYMRTDSTTISDEALSEAATVIRQRWGAEYYDGPRRYKTKARSAQEAHEAIRPTQMSRTPDQVKRLLDAEQFKVYDLIWRRAVASQMVDAEVDRTTVDFAAQAEDATYRYRSTGSVLRFPGFLEAIGRQTEDAVLPAMEEGQKIGGSDVGADGIAIDAVEPDGHETRPPARYTEASLVRKLEELGIGRPSTYTATISTIQDRDYVLKKGSALVPTWVGMAVMRLLRQHFPHYVDLQFTAQLEGTLDEIADGAVAPTGFLSGFYKGDEEEAGLVNRIEEELPRIDYPAIPLGPDPESGDDLFVRIGRSSAFVQKGDGDEAERVTVPRDLLIDELTVERIGELFELQAKGEAPIVQHPETGLPVFLKNGPYGPYVQLGEVVEGGDKPKRQSLPRGIDAADVTPELALKLLSLPRVLGVDDETGKTVTAGLGRYGPYVERDRTYRSIQSFDQIFEVGLEEAIQLINAKKARGKVALKEVGTHPDSGAGDPSLRRALWSLRIGRDSERHYTQGPGSDDGDGRSGRRAVGRRRRAEEEQEGAAQTNREEVAAAASRPVECEGSGVAGSATEDAGVKKSVITVVGGGLAGCEAAVALAAAWSLGPLVRDAAPGTHRCPSNRSPGGTRLYQLVQERRPGQRPRSAQAGDGGARLDSSTVRPGVRGAGRVGAGCRSLAVRQSHVGRGRTRARDRGGARGVRRTPGRARRRGHRAAHVGPALRGDPGAIGYGRTGVLRRDRADRAPRVPRRRHRLRGRALRGVRRLSELSDGPGAVRGVHRRPHRGGCPRGSRLGCGAVLRGLSPGRGHGRAGA